MITSTTNTVISVTGTDSNGNTFAQTITVPTVTNTSETFPAQFPLSLASGTNAFNTNAASFGYKMVTIVPPASSTALLYLGSSTAGQIVNPQNPISFGISGVSSINLFVGGSGVTLQAQAIFA